MFIEAKRIGNAEDRKAREQLFGYAANRGIPILVLTDGLRWNFYFGTGPGDWEERCFHRLMLDDDQKVSDYAKFLRRHLGRAAVLSGEARRSADRLLAEVQSFERAKRTLPDVWRRLLTEPHSQIRDLLEKRVRETYGVKPRAADVDSFLKEAATPTAVAHYSETIGRPHTGRRDAEGGVGEAFGRREEPTTLAASEAHARAPKLRQGLKTPQRDFRRPLLQILIQLGGRGERRQVLNQLAEVMASHLGDYDRETLESGSVRWEKNAEFECTEMRKAGLLKRDSARGWWEVSHQGRAYWSEER